jgi:hypothetical protein
MAYETPQDVADDLGITPEDNPDLFEELVALFEDLLPGLG